MFNEFENALKKALIEVYVDAYGIKAWNAQTDIEKSETLHKLLMGFLNAAKNK